MTVPHDIEARLNCNNWNFPPFNRIAFQRVQELFPTCRLSRNPMEKSQLGEAQEDLSQIAYQSPYSGDTTVADMLATTYTDAFLVVKSGKVIFEQYENGMTVDTPHLVNSITKSFVGMLVGIAQAEGRINVDSPASRYVPEISGSSAWELTSVRHLLDMTAGVSYSEDYDNPLDDFWQETSVVGWRPPLVNDKTPATLIEYAASRRGKDFEDGDKFIYKTIATNVLGMIVERVMGRKLQHVLEEKIWRPLRPRCDASIVVDRSFFPYVGAGMSACARDLGRFGTLIANMGELDGIQIIPAKWVADTLTGAPESKQQFTDGQYGEALPGWHYRNQVWVSDGPTPVMMALGIHGQQIYMNPHTKTAIVKLSSQPASVEFEMHIESLAAMEAISENLRTD